jgi:hypothetical protein
MNNPTTNPTLVLLAAGMSTRYGRLKQLEPVGPSGEALLDYAVYDAHRAGFSRVVLIIREEIEHLFREHVEGRWPADLEVAYHRQRLDDLPGAPPDLLASRAFSDARGRRTKPWGTAHAVLTAKNQLPGPFALLNADDFYGRESFGQAQSLTATLAGRPKSFGIVTYTLGDTLSDHGGVNRGVCQVDADGWLSQVRETLDIRPAGNGLFGRTMEGDPVRLDGSEPISTNFWVFDRDIFPILEDKLLTFLADVAGNADTQPEFLIPMVINHSLASDECTVQAVPTRGRFLGITHPPDRTLVVRGLEDMVRDGEYSTPLWG